MGQPAARVGDNHVCPAMNGPQPHVGGPVLPVGGAGPTAHGERHMANDLVTVANFPLLPEAEAARPRREALGILAFLSFSALCLSPPASSPWDWWSGLSGPSYRRAGGMTTVGK